jgi:PAS domain S-box-containing protein
MNIPQVLHILLHFSAFVAYVGLIVYVVSKNPRGTLNQLCTLVLTFFAVWSFGNTFLHSTTEISAAIPWLNLASIGWCGFPVAALWYCLVFTNHERMLKNPIFITICVLLVVFFIYLQWSGHLINEILMQAYGWSIVWAASPLPFIFFIYYSTLIAAVIWLSLDFVRRTKSLRQKKQARLFHSTAFVALILASATDVILPELGITAVPSIGNITVLICGFGIVYAVTRYGLMTLTPAAAADEILTTMGDSLILVGLDGKIILANGATSDLLGYPAEELVNKEFNSTIVAKATDGDALLREALEQGKISSRDVTYRARNGEGIPVLLSASVVKDKEGEPAGIVVTAHDMSEHKKMELSLRQSEERYRTLVDHALVGIGIHQNGRIVFANKELPNMLGYALEEGIGLSIAERIHPDERDFIMARARRRQAGGNEPETYEIRLLKKDGSVLYALISNAVLEYNGQPATLMTIADITDTKTRVELEQANKELEAFSYSVSHDLRAPLRSINGFSEALLEDYADQLDDTGKDYLHRVRAASQHMAQLIDDLLKLSRLTRAEMHYERVDLSALAQIVATELKETAPERVVEFVIAEGVVADGDAPLLRVVLENLLSNAWKFTGKHPRATIEFGVSQQEGQPVYFVRDDGAGFDMAYVNKLFVPFQRLHRSTEFEGTGIGLATVQRIIHRHGGSVWVEGEVGKGATFYFTLKS